MKKLMALILAGIISVTAVAAVSAEEDAPAGWGSQEERGVEMEITTAAACLVGGSNVVIMKHPAAIAATAKFIDSLM